jgi:hypothetical protein
VTTVHTPTHGLSFLYEHPKKHSDISNILFYRGARAPAKANVASTLLKMIVFLDVASNGSCLPKTI